MKKLMLMVGVLMMAAASFAAGVKMDGAAYTQIDALVAAKDAAGWKAFVLTLDTPTVANKVYAVRQLMGADWMSGTKVANLDAVKTVVAQYATQYGITDVTVIQDLTLAGMYDACDLCFVAGISKEEAFAFYKTIVAPTESEKNIGMYLSFYNGDVTGALAIGESMTAKTYLGLALFSESDPAKCFAYSKKALLTQTCSVWQVTDVLTRLWSLDFSDTAVTPQVQYDMLCAVNGKYSQMLVTDKANWESIVTRIQTAIAALKLQLGK